MEIYGNAKITPPKLAWEKMQEDVDALLIEAVRAIGVLQMGEGNQKHTASIPSASPSTLAKGMPMVDDATRTMTNSEDSSASTLAIRKAAHISACSASAILTGYGDTSMGEGLYNNPLLSIGKQARAKLLLVLLSVHRWCWPLHLPWPELETWVTGDSTTPLSCSSLTEQKMQQLQELTTYLW